MKDIIRYKIMRQFRSKHKIGEDLSLIECPDTNYPDIHVPLICNDLCGHIWPDDEDCPCHVYGCSTALRKLDAWLRKEKKRLGVKDE